jgi:hypothetical protein
MKIELDSYWICHGRFSRLDEFGMVFKIVDVIRFPMTNNDEYVIQMLTEDSPRGYNIPVSWLKTRCEQITKEEAYMRIMK